MIIHGKSDEVEKTISEDCRITTDDTAERVEVSHGNAMNIVWELTGLCKDLYQKSKGLLRHDNARPHTRLKTPKVITSFGWTTVTQSLYSLDLALTDNHCFGPL